MTLSAGASGSAIRRRWSPLELGSDLKAWWDAKDDANFTLVSGRASQWNDLSGNGYHATQGTSTRRPERVTDGLLFTPADLTHFVTDVPTGAYPLAFAALVKTTSNSNGPNLFGADGSGGATLDINQLKINLGSNFVAFILQGTSTIPSDTDAVIAGVLTSSTALISINGSTQSGSHSVALTSGRKLYVGTGGNNVGTPSTASTYNGTLREAIVSGALGTTNRQKVEGYLAWRWGKQASLPSDHPYKNIRP